ncbi:MAG: hypothetical protein AAF564_13460 [Bacteroidota bacterium]
MTREELAGLTDEVLLQEQKKVKTSKTFNAFLIGIFIGIAVYSAVRNGPGFATVFPLIFVYFAFRNGKKAQTLEQEVQARDIK